MLRSVAHISYYTNAQYDIQNWTGYMRNRYFSLNAILAHCGGDKKGYPVKNHNQYIWIHICLHSWFVSVELHLQVNQHSATPPQLHKPAMQELEGEIFCPNILREIF